MKVRFLGHSCVEIIGQHHILIDPDFTRDPEPGVEYICITHAHKDHIERVAEVPTGLVLAASDVCKIAAGLGVPRERLKPPCRAKKEGSLSRILHCAWDDSSAPPHTLPRHCRRAADSHHVFRS